MPFDATPISTPELVLLRVARNLIRTPRFWTKGEMVGGTGDERSCMLGALDRARNQRHDYVAHRLAENTMRQVVAARPGITDTISGFNDHWRTRHADVMAVFDEVEERLIAEAITKETTNAV